MKKEELKLKEFWPKFWRLLRPSQREIKILLFLTVIFELIGLISPYILKLIIDRITALDVSHLKPLLLLIIAFFVSEQVMSLASYIRDRLIFKITIAIEYYLPIEAQKKLVNLGLGYHQKENTGNKIIKIEKGLNKIISLVTDLAWEVGPTLIQLLVTFIVLIVVDWRLAASFLIFAPVFIYITYQSNSSLYPIRKKRYQDYERASGKMGQSIININAVQSFVQEEREVSEYDKIKFRIRFNELKEWFHLLNFGLYRNLVIDLGRVSILLLGVYLVVGGSMTIGTLVFVITLSEKAYFSLYRLSRFYDRVSEGAEAVNRLADILNQKQDIINPRGGLKPHRIKGELEFKNVSFNYINNSHEALMDINFKIKAQQVTALVGPSGSGKTTIARLIYRHYDPQTGVVLLDGRDLRNYDIKTFRRFLAVVPQEVEIFDLTIRDNIAYANPQASFKEVKLAAQIANAEEFIVKLDDSYNTFVGERGIKLSGGQRQRLGIARAILANPRILIFDEATSSLDSQSEKLIQDAMEKIGKSRTLVIIAHRLSTIKKADHIIVLEGGRVVEQGNHRELAQIKGGLYSRLIKLQTMGEID